MAWPSDTDLADGGLEALLASARAHGRQSDPDQEVGDLQEILRACWEVMTPPQRAQVFEAHRDLLDWRPSGEWVD
jgi:hypothetical protein